MIPSSAETRSMKWTTSLPDGTGWSWSRHTVADIPTDIVIGCIVMRDPIKKKGRWSYRYDRRPSCYWQGEWIDVSKFPTGYRIQWFDRPILLPIPRDHLFSRETL